MTLKWYDCNHTACKVEVIWLTWNTQTVPESSACLDNVQRIGLDVRHNMLHKHSSPEGDAFVRIAHKIKEFADGSKDTMARKGKLRS